MPELLGRAGWTALLDQLEQRAAEASIGMEPLESWHPDVSDDALPMELAERAAVVLAAQNRTIAKLQAHEQQIRSQLRLLGTSPRAASYDVPLYVDTIG